MIMVHLIVAALVLLSSAANAFIATPLNPASKLPSPSKRFLHIPSLDFDSKSTATAITNIITSSILSTADDEASLSPAVEAARQKFWFYFFAGSGAGGIGLSQLPAVFHAAAPSRAAARRGPTKGGSPLNAGPLVPLYYSADIALEDVRDVIDKAPSAEYISSRSQNTNYMASKGYIVRNDFIQQMEDGKKRCNPLASYALFDAISSGKGDVVSPVVYNSKLASYRDEGKGVDLIAGDLNGFLAVKVGAFLGLVFCLLIDVGFIAKAGIEGFLS